MDELAGHPAADDVVRRRCSEHLGRGDGHDGTESLAARDDQMGGDLVEIAVRRADRFVHRGLDALAVGIHRFEREER